MVASTVTARWHAVGGETIPALRLAAEAGDWAFGSSVLADGGCTALVCAVASGQAAGLGELLSGFPAGDAAVALALATIRLRDATAGLDLERGVRAMDTCPAAARPVLVPWLAALRVMLQAGAQPEVLDEAWALALPALPRASTLPEHRALGLLCLAVGTGRLGRSGPGGLAASAHAALTHAERQLGLAGVPALRTRAAAWRALAGYRSLAGYGGPPRPDCPDPAVECVLAAAAGRPVSAARHAAAVWLPGEPDVAGGPWSRT